MNQRDFNSILNNRILKTKTILQSKGAEYSSSIDRLHNFKVAAQMSSTGESPEQALWGMLRKHLVSVLGMVNAAGSVEISPHVIDEKIGDSINYLILLESLLRERLLITLQEERKENVQE